MSENEIHEMPTTTKYQCQISMKLHSEPFAESAQVTGSDQENFLDFAETGRGNDTAFLSSLFLPCWQH